MKGVSFKMTEVTKPALGFVYVCHQGHEAFVALPDWQLGYQCKDCANGQPSATP